MPPEAAVTLPATVIDPGADAARAPGQASRLIELGRPSVRRPTRRRVPRLLRRAVGPLVVLFVWWLVTEPLKLFSPAEIASPKTTWQAATQLWQDGQLQSNLWASLRRVLEGLALGTSAGVLLATLSGFFNLGEDLADPVLQAIRAVPVLGVLPLFIVWFGIGETPKVLLIALGSMFPIYLNTLGAIRGVDAKLIEAGETFGLGRLGIITNVLLPGALPGFLVGLRFALVASWLGVIIAEQINGQNGLGYMILNAETVNNIGIMFVGLIIFAILGIVADTIVRLLEKNLLVWRRGFTGN